MHSDVFSDGYGIKSLISYNYFCSVQTADMFTLVGVVIMQKISLSTKKLNTFGEKKSSDVSMISFAFCGFQNSHIINE